MGDTRTGWWASMGDTGTRVKEFCPLLLAWWCGVRKGHGVGRAEDMGL